MPARAAARQRAEPLPDWLKPVARDPQYKWAIKAWRKAAKVKGAWFDAAKADAAVALWPRVFRLTEARFAGHPFRLIVWQEIIVRLLTGWKKPVEVIDPATGKNKTEWVRLFRRLRLWIPRKNGKSEFLAALALLFWAMEGEAGGQGFVFARDEEQADTPFQKMRAMIAASEVLGREVQVFKTSLYLPASASNFKRLTGSDEGKHGKSPTVILGDEMHEWRTRKIEDDLRQGTGARLQPIEIYASTAGLKTNPVGVELYEESLAILSGEIDDPATLVVVFAADEKDDWTDERVWAKANPSLGLSPTIDYLRGESEKAKISRTKEAAFRCYHLGQWSDGETLWLDMAAWDRCSSGRGGWKKTAERMAGRRCYAAHDLSAKSDFTARVLLFPPEGDARSWTVLPRLWIPSAKLTERANASRTPFMKWRDDGAICVSPGNVIDQNLMLADMLDCASRFDIEGWGYDTWQSDKLVVDAQDDGFDPELLVEVRQGILSLSAPSKWLEELVLGGRLDHGGHPVLRWMARNTVVRFDENMNYMPAKRRSRDKIDGIMATVMALALAMETKEAPVQPRIIVL